MHQHTQLAIVSGPSLAPLGLIVAEEVTDLLKQRALVRRLATRETYDPIFSVLI